MKHTSADKEIDLIFLLKQVWLRRKTVLIWVLAGLLVGLMIAFSLPNQYKTEIIIAPEGKASAKSLGTMGALAGMMGANLAGSNDGIGEKLYPEIVKSTPFLMEFANIPVEYEDQTIMFSDYILKEYKSPWWSSVLKMPRKIISWTFGRNGSDSVKTLESSPGLKQAFAGRLGGLFKVEDKKNGTYILSVDLQDPKISVQIVDSMLVKLQRYMVDYQTMKTRQNLETNMKMLAEAKQKYYALDSEYAAAADRNQQLISKSAQVHLDRLQNERNLAFTIYQQLALQVESNRVKLQESTPIATVIEPARLPLRPTSPNCKLIIVGLMFLGGFICAGWIVCENLLSPLDVNEIKH